MRQLALRILGDAALAEDVVQESFLHALQHFDRYRPEADPYVWLRTIAVRAAIDRLRRLGRWTSDSNLIDQPAADSADAWARRQQLAEQLQSALGQLSAMERLAFLLRHVEQCDTAEVAAALGTNPNNSKQVTFRALQKLRTAMRAWREET